MIRSNTYASGFDEDVPSETTNPCPDCGGRVTTTIQETICEDCGLVIDDHRTNHRPEFA
ncbi:TFIIB-type zinc ribbon-containing protein [Haladaptatus sp. NG-SE-30]